MKTRERRTSPQRGSHKPTPLDASTPAALFATGYAHYKSARFLDAQLCGQQALATDPNHADTLFLMGLLALETGQPDGAVQWFACAISREPNVRYVSALGSALQRCGRLEEAAKALDKAVQLQPEDANLWLDLGIVLGQLKRSSDSVLCFQHALKLDPNHVGAASQLAASFHRQGDLEQALAYFDRCIGLRPSAAATLASRALVLRDLNRFEEYLSESLKAHALDPDSAEICSNVGDACLLLRRHEEALAWIERALTIRPDAIFALENKAIVLKWQHRFDELSATYDKIRSVDPSNVNAELSLAHTQLLFGNFEDGWRRREVRWRVPGLLNAPLDGPEPVWLGEESIEGKTLLVYADEGLGDAIQFVRYLPMLAARGARVVLVVQDSLLPLFSTMPGVVQCLPRSAPEMPPVDFRCPIMSLPLALHTTLDSIPPPIELPASFDRKKVWEGRLGPHDKLRIGLVWSGSLSHFNDFSRSIPLPLWKSLLEIDATFVSLQKDPRPDDAAALRELNTIVDLTTHLTDFGETAALVRCLDLVITVDTSTAHLAGTLGCPTWLLLPYTPDYRWLLDRDDSPWYPALRLFRQTETRDYTDVLERVRRELEIRANKYRRHK